MYKKTKITFWSDFTCPYCYIGETRLQKALAALGAKDSIELEMKAFQLEPDMSRRPNSGVYEKFVNQYGMLHIFQLLLHKFFQILFFLFMKLFSIISSTGIDILKIFHMQNAIPPFSKIFCDKTKNHSHKECRNHCTNADASNTMYHHETCN